MFVQTAEIDQDKEQLALKVDWEKFPGKGDIRTSLEDKQLAL